MPSNNMLTLDDKKFILMAINDSMVELAGTTADLIDGVTVKIEEVRNDLNEVKADLNEVKADLNEVKKDVTILKRQAIHTNEGIIVIRQDLVSLHRRVGFLDQGRADMINDADYDQEVRE